jgi:ubiquitin-protein ligase
MYESPRDRRLRSDLRAITRLKTQSSILDFEGFDNPPNRYLITLRGRGLMQPPNTDEVVYTDFHQVEIRLQNNYPRAKPDLKWRTPIFHPNISALGQVCLGGYSTNWVPSLNLDELCEMLWDMVRYANYDVKSPYNYKAARWVERQRLYEFPSDSRTLKDKLAAGLVSPDAPIPEPAPPPREEITFIGEDQPDEEEPDVFVIDDR